MGRGRPMHPLSSVQAGGAAGADSESGGSRLVADQGYGRPVGVAQEGPGPRRALSPLLDADRTRAGLRGTLCSHVSEARRSQASASVVSSPAASSRPPGQTLKAATGGVYPAVTAGLGCHLENGYVTGSASMLGAHPCACQTVSRSGRWGRGREIGGTGWTRAAGRREGPAC